MINSETKKREREVKEIVETKKPKMNQLPHDIKPKKKLIIKEFKVKPTIPENFEEDSWKKLNDAINSIFLKEATPYSQEELYKCVQDLCIHQKSENLLKNLRISISENLKKNLDPLLNLVTDNSSYLSAVVKTWDEFCSELTLIRNIFLYLDRTFVITTSTRSVWEMGLSLFRSKICLTKEIESKVEKGILELIEQERKGFVTNRDTMKKIARMLITMNIFEKLEQKIVAQTKSFYIQEAKNLIQTLDASSFLLHCEKRLHQESERNEILFSTNTKKLAVQMTEEKLIKDYTKVILEKGFDYFLSNHRIEELSKLYGLFEKVSCLPELFVCFSTYIKKNGTSLIEEGIDKTLISDILLFKKKIDEIFKISFKSNETFLFDYKQSFERFINSKSQKVAELTAKFIDSKLRTGNKGLTEDDLEKIMIDTLTIFKFLEGKDVFEAYYKKDFAKRLLLGRSASFDCEKAFISKLKTESGATFTNKLEGMLKDIDLSKGMMEQFKISKENEKVDIELSVTIITTGYWPPYHPVVVNLPKNIQDSQEIFKTFYLEKFTGRQLTWQTTLSNSNVRATFPNGKKELLVSCFQTVVLLLFNEMDEMTYKEISDSTQIEQKELISTLLSLSQSKILISTNEGEEINQEDKFTFNKGFEHQLFKIKINSVQIKETVEEKEQTDSKILIERQHTIDACIVRIMKSRKRLGHSLLISEIFSQLKFPMKNSDLKKRIESLIERDYLVRENGDETLYIYQA